jgi:hypothetical protein
LMPALAGDRGPISDLPVTIETRTGEKTLLCEAPKPKFSVLRGAAAIGVTAIGALVGF